VRRTQSPVIKNKVLITSNKQMWRRLTWRSSSRACAPGRACYARRSGASLICKSERSVSSRLYSSQLIVEFDSLAPGPALEGVRQGTGLFNIPGLDSPEAWGRLASGVEEEVERLVTHVRRRTAENKKYPPPSNYARTYMCQLTERAILRNPSLDTKVDLVRALDRISATICSVVDPAELCRYIPTRARTHARS
jgi:hypothetical protein